MAATGAASATRAPDCQLPKVMTSGVNTGGKRRSRCSSWSIIQRSDEKALSATTARICGMVAAALIAAAPPSEAP